MSHIDLWRFDLDQPDAVQKTLSGFLSRDELERADRYSFDRDRRRYIAGRGYLRLRIGEYLKRQPSSLRLGTTQFGKPTLLDAGLLLHFNLSHSGSTAVLAVSADFPLGIDIADIQDVDDDLALHSFAPGEYARLRDTNPDERTAAFFRCWTRKEAFVKALGVGLSLPLDSFEISMDEEPEPRLLWWRGHPEAPARWRFFSFSCAPGTVGALAVDAQGCDCAVNWRN